MPWKLVSSFLNLVLMLQVKFNFLFIKLPRQLTLLINWKIYLFNLFFDISCIITNDFVVFFHPKNEYYFGY